MKKIFNLLVAGFMAVGWAQAQAQSSQSNMMSGFMVGAEGAYVWASEIGDDNLDYYFGTPVEEKRHAAGYRVFVGYQFDPNVSLELGYFGTDNLRKTWSISGTLFGISGKVHGWELTPVFKLTQGVPGLFFKAGVTYSTAENNIEVGQTSVASIDDDRGTGYLLGLGYEYSFTSNLAARIAYTRYERLGGESGNKLNLISAGLKFTF